MSTQIPFNLNPTAMKKAIVYTALIIFTTFGASVNLLANDNYDLEKEAAERTKRQLELANQLRKERLKKQREKEKKLQIEEKTRKSCVKMEDDLRRFNERRRWYRLDENGERVFLSDKEVEVKRQSIQKKYDSHCASER